MVREDSVIEVCVFYGVGDALQNPIPLMRGMTCIHG